MNAIKSCIYISYFSFIFMSGFDYLDDFTRCMRSWNRRIGDIIYTVSFVIVVATDNNILGVFTEADIFFSKELATKIGVRLENNEFSNEFTFSPRISLAYKAGKNDQFSLAYGEFYQNPRNEYST